MNCSLQPERWYSVKEVAGVYGYSDDTIRRLIQRGIIKAIAVPQLKRGQRSCSGGTRIKGAEAAKLESLLAL